MAEAPWLTEPTLTQPLRHCQPPGVPAFTDLFTGKLDTPHLHHQDLLTHRGQRTGERRWTRQAPGWGGGGSVSCLSQHNGTRRGKSSTSPDLGPGNASWSRWYRAVGKDTWTFESRNGLLAERTAWEPERPCHPSVPAAGRAAAWGSRVGVSEAMLEWRPLCLEGTGKP